MRAPPRTIENPGIPHGCHLPWYPTLWGEYPRRWVLWSAYFWRWVDIQQAKSNLLVHRAGGVLYAGSSASCLFFSNLPPVVADYHFQQPNLQTCTPSRHDYSASVKSQGQRNATPICQDSPFLRCLAGQLSARRHNISLGPCNIYANAVRFCMFCAVFVELGLLGVW